MDVYATLDIVLRLAAALVASAAIGLERESHGRAAGLRTTVLVGVAAAMAMTLSEEPYLDVAHVGTGAWRPDPMRLAAGVLTGMGFLGAGTIIKEGNMVRGVTTAATLWLVAILGLAFGAGFYLLGAIGWGLAMFTLFALPRFEHLIKNDWYGSISLVIAMDGIREDEVRQRVKSHGVAVKSMEIDYDVVRRTRTLTLTLKYKKDDLFDLSQRVMQDLITAPGVQDLKWR
jgi:putative Mg2+ transporter-C (MgtC) family protein